MSKKKHDDDDGRQLADMSGVVPSSYGLFPERMRRKPAEKRKPEAGDEAPVSIEPMTKKETRSMLFQAMWASMLIALIFIALAALFILFSIHVWFK
ncbi:MAG: hypothetical protein JXB33_06225 [Clostridia bacterium]|nr:hypothetical protein [Clostridia bacterium]